MASGKGKEKRRNIALGSVQDFSEGLMRDASGPAPGTPTYYAGDTVADLNDIQYSALNQMARRGGAGSMQEQLFGDYLSGSLAGGAAEQRDAMSALMGGLDAGQSALSGLAGGGMGLGEAADFARSGLDPYNAALQQQASGAINPLTGAMYQQAAGNLGEAFQESVMPGINATFAAGGRTGSGLHADAVGNAAGELADAQSSMAADMFGGAAESALSRQLAAAQGGMEGMLSANQLAGSLYNQGADRQLAAAGQLQSGAMGGLDALQSLQNGAASGVGAYTDLEYNNLDRMLNAGTMFQDQEQRETDADIARYEHNSTRALQDWERNINSMGARAQAAAPLAGTGESLSGKKGKNKGGYG